MLFGVVPSAKNSDFTARLRHLPSLFIFFAPSIFDAEYNFVNKIVWFQPTNANTERDASNKHLDWTD